MAVLHKSDSRFDSTLAAEAQTLVCQLQALCGGKEAAVVVNAIGMLLAYGLFDRDDAEELLLDFLSMVRHQMAFHRLQGHEVGHA
jgi:hypothetical protein